MPSMIRRDSGVPLVSVVMPVRNEGRFIGHSLGAVLAQDYPADRLEVIVADGRSTDETASVVCRLQATHDNLKLIDNPGQIAASALNCAIAQARGDIIVRVDGHCEIAPDYVSNCVRHLQVCGEPVAAVGGPLATLGETALAGTIAVAMSSNFGVGRSAFRTAADETRLVDTVAFPAFRRSALDRAGPFDEELVRNQDDEYSYRLRKLGYGIFLASDVRARYYSRSTLRSLWRQYFEYGYWKVRVLQKHPRQMSGRQFVPPVFAAALILSCLLALLSSRGRWLAGLVVLAYVGSNLVAAVYTAARRGWRHLPLLPMCFAILHLAYGFGFLWGLCRFARGWRENLHAVRTEVQS